MTLGYVVLSKFPGAIHWRDGGICILCGIDCDLLRAWLSHYRRIDWNLFKAASAVLTAAGFDLHLFKLWQADHIVPVSEGGPTTMENGRILCHPCHKRVTKEMHQRRKAARSSPYASKSAER
jgi:hypothetical protein